MKQDELEILVQDYLTGKKEKYDKTLFNIKCSSSLEKFKLNTAVRLCKNCHKFTEKDISLNDFLCSLRNYLLVFNTDVVLKEGIDINNNGFGLLKDSYGKVYASLDMPQYVNSKLIKSAFMKDYKEEKNDSKYFLGTSPYVYSLTRFKKYKSLEQKLGVVGALKTPDGYTTVVSLPTGAGKSLITQVLAYQKERSLTIVLVPTVSLAIDQVRAAKSNIYSYNNNEIFCYYSGMNEEIKNEMINSIKNETAKLLFISPEALIQNQNFKKLIEEANEKRYLKNIVIDEAHIVIEWGAYFRINYQCIEAWRNNLLLYNSEIRTYLLSATFEKSTVKKLKQMFSSEDKCIEVRCDFLRKEPRYSLVQTSSYGEKNNHIIELVKKLPRPLVIYVTSPDKADNVKKLLGDNGFNNIETFTGKTKNNERERIIKEWVNNEFDTIIATSAFGVGVDKSDVRTVLHLYVPENPNKYYQELGRGGRDGLPSLSVMCINTEEDLDSAFKMTDKVMLPEKILGRWESMLNGISSKRYKSIYTLDTSIKPNYNEPDYSEDINITHIQWNMYVILFLRRYGLINITDIIFDFETKKYLISIEIISDELLRDDARAFKIISEIREKEKKKFMDDFKVMKRSISNSKLMCWSEMFYETYELVSEYCSGCNMHDDIVDVQSNHFSLLKRINDPINKISFGISELLGNADEALIFSPNDNYRLLNTLINKGITTIVISDEDEIKYMDLILNLQKETHLNIMGMDEYIDLLKEEDYFYVSGTNAILYGNNPSKIFGELNCIRKYANKNICNIHIFENDIYFDHIGKMASGIINGPQIESYIIERMN
ncbi:ATP-dependent DNA helicase RecQ [Clostridium butyricum]|uniref:helicase-related protein n=1 Tax=Clostridium butyricum TaxID=1492 RepID=UPI001BAC33B0|nr:helicase-related protein [Clostridium butyricum]QUF82108.1 ATP-dependent DNA helicase RecQ [Clostridium butyricum]